MPETTGAIRATLIMSGDLQAHSKIEVGSNRSFGLVFFAVFLVVGLWPLLGDGGVRAWSLIVAGLFLFFSFFFSEVLRPLNVLWFRFGMLLAKVVNPIRTGRFVTRLDPSRNR